MQIIQSIREKGAAIIIVVIALSLIGFILMDAKQGTGRASFNDTIGKVNGESITLPEFNKRVSQAEGMEAQRSGQQPSGARVNQIREQVWNQMIAEKIFYKEAGKVGITLTNAEMQAVLFSDDPANPFMQEREFLDPATGKLDQAKVRNAYAEMRKSKGEQRESIDATVIEPVKISTAVAKYSGLLNAAAYYPTWMKEKEQKEAGEFATISYVTVPYNEIPDDQVKVSDADINAYVEKHKALFKQEAGRTISYATFSQLPTAQDSAAARKSIEDLKMTFASDTNTKAFLSRNTSTIDFQDTYLPKSKIATAYLDTITRQPIGTVYGPYAEGKNFVLAKILGVKTLPDSAKARHILIAANDLQTGKPIMSDSSAKKLADSLLAAIKAGADFGALAQKYSADKGSGAKGGDLGTFGYGTMVSEFNDFAFTKPVGTTDVVKTQFGYHIINVESQKDPKPAYKIAFMAKEITASEATVNAASLEATRASAQKTKKDLETYLKPAGKALVQSPVTIKENDFSVGNMQDARGLVKWAFEADKGDVSEPFAIGDDFIVATVDNIYKEGVQDAATARPGAEAVIRNEKKSEIIIKKMGENPTLQAAASAYNKQIAMAGADSSITMSAQLIPNVGIEYKVIGAAFNKANQTKPSPAIAGTTGVFVMQTTGIFKKSDPTPDAITGRGQQALNKMRTQAANWFEALKKQADIQDKRNKAF